MFFYSNKLIDIDLFEPFIEILEELNIKQRQIRSLRGFFLYVLEIMQKGGKDLEILKTNLQPSFWRKLKAIMKQNKKVVLLEFLFGSQQELDLEEKIQNLETKFSSLQQKLMNLEGKLKNLEYALSGTLEALESSKMSQQGNSTLKNEQSSQRPNLLTNGSEVSLQSEEQSNVLSEASQSSLEPLSGSHPKNLPFNQEKGLPQPNFITLGRIPEEEQIEIIQRGFQLQAEGKISLKKYYEGTDPNSLVQSKGYSIKYETIRRNKLYQQLKPSNN